jgi:uncharacterized protein (DUF924 family)
LAGWRKTGKGRLAEIIVLDQFSRNLFRDDPRAYAADPLALALAQEAIAADIPTAFSAKRRVFFYLPFMHSESRLVQTQSVRLFEGLGLAKNLDFARQHQAVIERFGRFPHRNAALGRTSTPEEIAYLAEPGSGF